MKYRRQSGTFQFEEDTFPRNAEGISKIYHEVLLILKCLQTKPDVRGMNVKYFDLYQSVIKNGNEKKNLIDDYEHNENEKFEGNKSITPNHYARKKMMM